MLDKCEKGVKRKFFDKVAENLLRKKSFINDSSSEFINEKNKNHTWQGMQKMKLLFLKDQDKKAIINNEKLTDYHMCVFISVVQNQTSYLPYDTVYIQKIDRIKAVPKGVNHLQNLPGSDHWVTSFYDSQSDALRIYDSLNNKCLLKEHELFLKKLFPHKNLNDVQFIKVQMQADVKSCGVHAIAMFVTSLLGSKPELMNYNLTLMRSHLLMMLNNHKIIHFPIESSLEKPLTSSNKVSCESLTGKRKESSLSTVNEQNNVATKKFCSNYLSSEKSEKNKIICKEFYEKNKSEILLTKSQKYKKDKIKILSQQKKYRKNNKNKYCFSKSQPLTSQKNKNDLKNVHSQQLITYATKRKFIKFKICKKYTKVRSTLKAKQNFDYYVQKLIEKMNNKQNALIRMEAEAIVKWCLNSRKIKFQD